MMSSPSSANANASPSTVHATPAWLNQLAKKKTTLLQDIFGMEPIHVSDVKDPLTKKVKPRCQGEDIVAAWEQCYSLDPLMQSIVIDTAAGPSTPHVDHYDAIARRPDGSDGVVNPVMPYQQLRALVGDGGTWKWPALWKQLDCLPRRGPCWRHPDDPSNLGTLPNPHPHVVPLRCLVVGGGPVGLRLAIELVLGGHRATVFEKRRGIPSADGTSYASVGFTNRVNRPHINNFCRNDLDRLNGRNFMTSKMCYPIFTASHTSSIGVDELQMMLLKTALLLGVQFELGVGFVDATVEITNHETNNQRPVWKVQYTADSQAQETYHKTATGGTQQFDALFGCDGTASQVRKTQVDWLGQTNVRKYKKMLGVVANLRKVSRKTLRDQGFYGGLEPEDQRSDNKHFYKASYHNYLILQPSLQEMEDHGIPWQSVFSYHKNMTSLTKEDQEKDALKAILKRYVQKKAQELRIPLDTTLENDGLVDAPNDVMAFDFSEFYNCEKSAAFYAPPLEWDAERDGEWEIQCPLVVICGDAVADPNWLLGVGLQRGWNTAFDAAFYADNIYNNKTFNGQPPSLDHPLADPIEWTEHLENMMTLMTTCRKSSLAGKLTTEMGHGTYDAKGPVNIQIARVLTPRKIDWVPSFDPPLEPWYRYAAFASAVRRDYAGERLNKNRHPATVRHLALFEHNQAFVERANNMKRTTRPTPSLLTWPKRFECSEFWCGMSMKLLQIGGKTAPGARPLGRKEDTPKSATEEAPAVPLPEKKVEVVDTQSPKDTEERLAIDLVEIKSLAQQKSFSLRQKIVESVMAGPRPGMHQQRRNSVEHLLYPQEEPLLSTAAVPAARRPSVHPLPRSSGIQKSASTSDTVLVGGGGSHGVEETLMSRLHLKTVQYKKDSLTLQVACAKAEAKKVWAEKVAMDAKLAYAETEVTMLSNLLNEYIDAESRLQSINEHK